MRSALVMVTAAFMLASASASHAQERLFTFVVKGSLTPADRAAAVYTAVRTQSPEFSNYYGLGAELQYYFPGSNVFVSLSSEYVRNSGKLTIQWAQRSIPVEDSYIAIPVEITGYFRIPVTGGPLSVFMGGGGGVYFGHRRYSMAGVDAPTTATQAGYGIHVLGGVGYRFTGWFSAQAELKFRETQFQTTNAFQVPGVKYGDLLVNLPQGPFETSIHTDGMVIQFGLGFSF